MPDQLTNYIKTSLSQGVSENTIRENLLKNGWTSEQIDKTFVELNNPQKEESKTQARRNFAIFGLAFLFSFFTTPIYFLPPDGPVVKFLLATDPNFKNSELAGGALLGIGAFLSIPIMAGILSALLIIGLNSLRTKKALAYTLLGLFGFGVLIPVLIIVSGWIGYTKEISSIPSKVDFQVYKPNKNNPFKGLNESYLISDSSEKRCRAIEYTYYASLSGVILTELKADSPGCPDAFNFNSSDYKRFSDLADSGKTEQYTNFKVVKKQIGAEQVLLVRDTGSTLLSRIYGIKDGTLVIVTSECTITDNQTTCEQKYFDFYASLEPLK